MSAGLNFIGPPRPEVIYFDGKDIEKMTREELLVAMRAAMAELDGYRMRNLKRWTRRMCYGE